MREGWELKKLGDTCQFVRGPFGGSLKKDCFVADGFGVYEQQHAIYDQFDEIRYFIDEDKFAQMKRFELFPGDLIMSCSGTMGKVAIVPTGIKRGVINQALLKLTPKNVLDVEYLKYWMESDDFKDSISKYSKGAAIKNVASVQILKTIALPFPVKVIQQQIVSILDETFTAIDQAKANVERNLQNAKELFQSELNNIFSQKGEGWVEKRLGEILQKTETIDPTKTPGKEFLYIDVSSVNKETLLIEDANLIKGKDAPSRARKVVRTHDVIFATVRPTLKRIAIIGEEYDAQICSTGYFVLRSNEGLNNTLLFYYLQSYYFQDRMEKLQKGASYPAVTDAEVRQQLISYPIGIGVQQSLVSKLDSLYNRTQALETLYKQKLNELEDLRKSILQRAFNGELKTTLTEIPA